jgi:hypothetical protein
MLEYTVATDVFALHSSVTRSVPPAGGPSGGPAALMTEVLLETMSARTGPHACVDKSVDQQQACMHRLRSAEIHL